MRVYNERATDQAGATPGTHADVSRFFAGKDRLDTGVVELPDWRPGPAGGPAIGSCKCGAASAANPDRRTGRHAHPVAPKPL